MRKQLFKSKMSNLGSVLSLTGIVALTILFSFALPGFLSSTTGRLFAMTWAVLAIVMFIAHLHRFSFSRRRNLAQYLAGNRKDVRSTRSERRYMRG